MAKLIHVSREKVEAGRKKMDELLAENEFWREEQVRIKEFEAQEKARRDAEYAAKQKEDSDSPKVSR